MKKPAAQLQKGDQYDTKMMIGFILSNVVLYAAVFGFCVWWTR